MPNPASRLTHPAWAWSLLLLTLPFAAGGCVTAHDAKVKLVLTDFHSGETLDEAYLLIIRKESVEKQGHFWVAQEAPSGYQVPMTARVIPITSGQEYHQEGKVVTAMGPYMYDTSLGHEYWVFRKGYMPDDFLNTHLERTYKNRKEMKILLEKATPGRPYSDEKILDGARQLVAAFPLLANNDAHVIAACKVALEQTQKVLKLTYKERFREEAREIAQALQARLAKSKTATTPKPKPAQTP